MGKENTASKTSTTTPTKPSPTKPTNNTNGSATAATAGGGGTEPEELPKTIVRRVVKEKLAEISNDGGDVNLHKEALLAFSESARIFIHYLSATANDICTESRRQIINAEDVLKALDEIEFSEFVDPLRASLEDFRKKAAGKRAGAAKAKEVNKKSKTVKEKSTENGDDEAIEDNEENGVDGGEEENEEIEEGASEEKDD